MTPLCSDHLSNGSNGFEPLALPPCYVVDKLFPRVLISKASHYRSSHVPSVVLVMCDVALVNAASRFAPLCTESFVAPIPAVGVDLLDSRTDVKQPIATMPAWAVSDKNITPPRYCRYGNDTLPCISSPHDAHSPLMMRIQKALLTISQRSSMSLSSNTLNTR